MGHKLMQLTLRWSHSYKWARVIERIVGLLTDRDQREKDDGDDYGKSFIYDKQALNPSAKFFLSSKC